FGGRSLARLQSILFTSGTGTRAGLAVPPDTEQIQGVPIWRGDSLDFIPQDRDAQWHGQLPAAVAVATQRQREKFLEIARIWRVEDTKRADGMEAVAVALDMLGDRAALDTFR